MKEYYRVKTEKELEEEFGRDWRNRLRPYWAKEMDYLCGQKLSDKQARDYLNKVGAIKFNCKDKYPEQRWWHVAPQAIIKITPDAKCAPQHKQVYLTIDLTSDGTLTVDYSGFESVAKCHPDDEFDYRKGMAIAFARLARQLGEYEIEKEKTIVVKEKVKCNILDEL